MNDIFLKYEEMPHTIAGFYTKIKDNEYIILNKLHNKKTLFLTAFSCLYYKDNGYNVGKVNVSDLHNPDFLPLQYAKELIGDL